MNPKHTTYIGLTAKIIILLGVAVLLGWQFRITAFTNIFPRFTAMNPFAALAFIASAAWQLLCIPNHRRQGYSVPVLHTLLAAFVFAVGFLRTIEWMQISEVGFDKLLFSSKPGISPISQLGALNFALMGAAMLLSGHRLRRANAVLFLLTPVFAVSMMSLFGYAIGNNNAETLRPFLPISIHATLFYLALVSTFLLLVPDNMLVKRALSKDIGGFIVRQLLPYIFAVPFALGLLCFLGVRSGLYDFGFAIGMFLVAYILMALLIVVWQSMAVRDLDLRRFEAEQAVAQRSAELEQANRQLEERNKELEQFAFAASHDMQEPLRKISSFSSYLLQHKNTQLDGRSQEYLDKINISVLRMKKIIDDLLNYSHHTRHEAGQPVIDLNGVITSIENDFELLLGETGAIIQTAPLPALPASGTQMHQLFFNLIANAIKFARPGITPIVRITSQPFSLPADAVPFTHYDAAKDYVQISIADNGIGFKQEYAEQIFGLFKRLHSRGDYEGTGIGLALCKKVVENHRGHIWAEGVPGAGATFHVVLPAS